MLNSSFWTKGMDCRRTLLRDRRDARFTDNRESSKTSVPPLLKPLNNSSTVTKVRGQPRCGTDDLKRFKTGSALSLFERLIIALVSKIGISRTERNDTPSMGPRQK